MIPSGAMTEPASSQVKPWPSPSRRRDKPQLSCNRCRKQKYACSWTQLESKDLLSRLKCDRGQPCKTCDRRGLSLFCAYASDIISGRFHSTVTKNPTPSLSIRDTISELETLVIELGNTTGACDEIVAILEKVSAVACALTLVRAHTLARALGSNRTTQVEVIKQHFVQNQSSSSIFLPTEVVSGSTALPDPERSTEQIRKASSSSTLFDEPNVEMKRHPNPFFPHLYIPITDKNPTIHVMWG